VTVAGSMCLRGGTFLLTMTGGRPYTVDVASEELGKVDGW